MQKIRITSTSKIDNVKSLENIDISYGISYFGEDKKIKTFDSKNSWSMKVLSKIDNVIQFFAKKEERNHHQEIIHQIIEDSQFLDKYHSEDSKNLNIQINSENKIIKVIKDYSKNLKQKTQDLTSASNAYVIHSNNQKNIFLGLDVFKEKSKFLNGYSDNVGKKISVKDIASFIFFHEYAHTTEAQHHDKYIPSVNFNNKSFDVFYFNLRILSNKENYKEVQSSIKDKIHLQMPHSSFIDNLKIFYQEMYADTNALLLMRNKSLIDGTYNQEKFEDIINYIINVRRNEQRLYSKEVEEFILDLNCNDHFTVPSIESLSKHLKEYLDGNLDKVLTNEDMYKIITKCTQEGMAKNILMMNESIAGIQSELNTILSMKFKNKQLEIDDNKDNLIGTMERINQIVPNEWKDKFKRNLEKMPEKIHQLVFDAAMDYEEFDKKIKQYPKKEIKEDCIVNEPLAKIVENIELRPNELRIIPDIELNIEDLTEIKKEKLTENESKTINYETDLDLPLNSDLEEAIKIKKEHNITTHTNNPNKRVEPDIDIFLSSTSENILKDKILITSTIVQLRENINEKTHSLKLK